MNNFMNMSKKFSLSSFYRLISSLSDILHQIWIQIDRIFGVGGSHCSLHQATGPINVIATSFAGAIRKKQEIVTWSE
jgi:hypothetical protein